MWKDEKARIDDDTQNSSLLLWLSVSSFWPWWVHCALDSSSVSSLDVESKTLQGVKGELVFDASGQYHLENTTLDYQKLSDKEILRVTGPLGADFTVKVRAQMRQLR